MGASRAARLRAAHALELSESFRPATRLTVDAAALPFMRIGKVDLPIAQPRLVRVDDLERAFRHDLALMTRLVLTHSTYLLQKWIDILGPDDRIVATADRIGLETSAPEAFAKRGPWRFFRFIDAESDREAIGSATGIFAGTLTSETFSVPADPVVSRVCQLLVEANACRDRGDLPGARRALDEALKLTPEWEAVQYEDGKLWLACDDTERARQAFQRAADLMPTFSSAFSNLGATLGELDQPEAAVAAFSRALEHDPDSFTILNNIGVVNRELGRLEESERALVRVTELAPGFVFGHYNLGHTRFLRGNYGGAVLAYEEGQRRDPENNRRQGCRLALARFGAGDVKSAEKDLWRFADQAPPEEREDLLLEAYEVAQALVRTHPHLASGQGLLDRIAAELST